MSQKKLTPHTRLHLTASLSDGGFPTETWIHRFRELSWNLAIAETPAQTVRAMKDLDRHARSRTCIESEGAVTYSPRWKYVPLEPTLKMLDAAVLAEWAVDPKDTDRYHAAVYRAMIARAPRGAGEAERGKRG